MDYHSNLITGGRIVEFISFPLVLGLDEMQTSLSKTWSWVAVFISNDDNLYATGAFGKSIIKSIPNIILSIVNPFHNNISLYLLN